MDRKFRNPRHFMMKNSMTRPSSFNNKVNSPDFNAGGRFTQDRTQIYYLEIDIFITFDEDDDNVNNFVFKRNSTTRRRRRGKMYVAY